MNRDALLLELAGFLAYEAAYEEAECFWDWVERTGHTWPERAYLEVAYMGATVLPELQQWQ